MGEIIGTAIKTGVIVVITGVFLLAITSLTSLIVAFGQSTILGEILGMISMCVPFDLGAVVMSLMSAFDAIITFQVAKKVFNTLVKSVDAT